MSLILYIGDRNYSSWSLRPWLALQKSGLRFETRVVWLDRPDTAQMILAVSPSGKVPVLHIDDVVIWDTLSICEWVAERAPHMWPSDPMDRARARSVTAEMHSSFGDLRKHCPMNIRRVGAPLIAGLPDGVLADVRRIEAIWAECRDRARSKGPYLFGSYSIADAFYAPVCTRIRSYAIPVSAEAAAYVDAVLGDEDFGAWAAEARIEQNPRPQYDNI